MPRPRATDLAPPLAVAALFALSACSPGEPALRYEVRQLTRGPEHHFYGYIGHVGNSPYSADGRYLLLLRTSFQDRMPGPGDAADVVLLDAAKDYAAEKIDETRGWNPQQGAMLYWNPDAPTTQFFFNDRDPATGKVFTALYDLVEGRRVREFSFEDRPVASGGVNQEGGAFAGLNYARMARLRPVTGYPGASDWTEGVQAPEDDGLWLVDVDTGAPRLLVSFRQLRDTLAERHPGAAIHDLFLNHTLWSRDGRRLFFFVRGNFDDRENRVNVPMTVRPDGSELTEQRLFIGGHPEWADGTRMIGAVGDELVVYDTAAQEIVETLGGPTIFEKPGGDTALSWDGEWLVNGATDGPRMHYVVMRMSDRATLRTSDFDRAGYESGDLRIDPAPCWNRQGDRFAFPALAADGTRQTFEVRILR